MVEKSSYQVTWHGRINWSRDDQPYGLLSRLPEDGGHLLRPHPPQTHVANGKEVVAVLEMPILQKEKKVE